MVIPTQEEVWNTLKGMGSLKSPGPDGMPPIFYKKYWDKVGNEVTSLIKHCFSSASIPNGLNHTNLVLIPKVKHPSRPVEYRPIALCNILYKIVVKIIAQRLKPMLDQLVDKAQSAFVPGRLILDNILTAKELIHSMNQSNSVLRAFAHKIDISKAYDRVSWNFPSQCLRVYGICGDTHKLIMNCVTTTSFSIIVNGTPEGHFTSGRGLRQGCPLSSYLFILCAQGLSWIIRKMEASTLYNGYRVNIWAPSISHLMFADDLFFFSTLDDRTLQSLQDILFIYARWSGQQANLDKSAILFSKGVGEDRRQSISDMLGVKQMESNDKYLGFQLLKSAHRIKSYEFLHEKFDNKLVGWKRIFP